MARIFIAIRFDDEVKKALVGLQDTLKAKGVKGNYCPYRNLHMTLAFIGETYDLSEISKAVRAFHYVTGQARHLSYEIRRYLVWHKRE